MDINIFIERVGEQFDELDGVVLGSETVFREVPGWCSIVALSIIAMVDEEYGVTLRGDDIKTSNTIRDLFDKILSKK